MFDSGAAAPLSPRLSKSIYRPKKEFAIILEVLRDAVGRGRRRGRPERDLGDRKPSISGRIQ